MSKVPSDDLSSRRSLMSFGETGSALLTQRNASVAINMPDQPVMEKTL